MDSDAGLSEQSLEHALDEIICEIDVPFGALPIEAIRAAQKHRDQRDVVDPIATSECQLRRGRPQELLYRFSWPQSWRVCHQPWIVPQHNHCLLGQFLQPWKH